MPDDATKCYNCGNKNIPPKAPEPTSIDPALDNKPKVSEAEYEQMLRDFVDGK